MTGGTNEDMQSYWIVGTIATSGNIKLIVATGNPSLTVVPLQFTVTIFSYGIPPI
jgi:hypothetical protein